MKFPALVVVGVLGFLPAHLPGEEAPAPEPDMVAQVQQVLAENPDLARSVTEIYGSYLSALLNGVEQPATPMTPAAPVEPTATVAVPAVVPARLSPLRTSRLHASGPLIGAHLDTYPALPEIAPTASILYPTSMQLQQGVELAERMRERKRFYMQLRKARE